MMSGEGTIRGSSNRAQAKAAEACVRNRRGEGRHGCEGSDQADDSFAFRFVWDWNPAQKRFDQLGFSNGDGSDRFVSGVSVRARKLYRTRDCMWRKRGAHCWSFVSTQVRIGGKVLVTGANEPRNLYGLFCSRFRPVHTDVYLCKKLKSST